MNNKKITELTPNEMKSILKEVIKNNVELAKNGIIPTAFRLIGEAGIAKTSLVEQVAQESFNTHHFIKINPSCFEVGDLIGFPLIQFEICEKDDKCIWVAKELLSDFISNGYKPTGRDRMSYSKPEWIEGKENKPVILLIDDKTRATPMVLQAIMDLEDRQSASSWSLPKGSTVISTENPSNGDYIVSESDSAQSSRSLAFYIKADVDSWSYWATNKIQERFINFINHNPEVITGTNVKDEKLANLRVWTKFFNTISGIDNIKNNWNMVLNIGVGSIPEEHLLLFSTFCSEGLDTLPKAIDCINGKISIDELKKITQSKNIIKVLLSRRLLNYVLVNTKLKNEQYDKYIEILNSEILNSENEFNSVVTLYDSYNSQSYLINKIMESSLKNKLIS